MFWKDPSTFFRWVVQSKIPRVCIWTTFGILVGTRALLSLLSSDVKVYVCLYIYIYIL